MELKLFVYKYSDVKLIDKQYENKFQNEIRRKSFVQPCVDESVWVSVCVFRSAQIRRYPNPVKVSRETRNKHDNIVARNKIEKVE